MAFGAVQSAVWWRWLCTLEQKAPTHPTPVPEPTGGWALWRAVGPVTSVLDETGRLGGWEEQ